MAESLSSTDPQKVRIQAIVPKGLIGGLWLNPFELRMWGIGQFFTTPFRGQVAIGIEPDRIVLENGKSWEIRKNDNISFVEYKGWNYLCVQLSFWAVNFSIYGLACAGSDFMLHWDLGAISAFAIGGGVLFLIYAIPTFIEYDKKQMTIYFFPVGKRSHLLLEIPPKEADLLPERLQQLGLAVKRLAPEVNPFKWRKMIQAKGES